MNSKTINHKTVLRLLLSLVITLSYNYGLAAKKPSPAALMPSTTTVSTITAAEIPWQPSTQSVGTLSSYEGAVITAEAAGRVSKIYFKSGQTIKKGQALADIYPDIVKAQLNQALADQEINCMTYKRYKSLATQDYASQQKSDEELAQCQKSIATVKQIKAQLTQYEIKAPFSGKLGLMDISLGQYLSAGSPIVNLQRIDQLRVEFSLPENYLAKIKSGQTVSFTSNAYPQQIFHGKVYAIDSSINNNTRMISIRADVPNDDGKLLPGGFVDVTLYLDQAHKVVVIPTTAVQYDKDGDYVYLLSQDKKKAIKTSVQLGKQLNNNEIIISHGLNKGDIIITNGEKINMTGVMDVKANKDGDMITQQYRHDIKAMMPPNQPMKTASDNDDNTNSDQSQVRTNNDANLKHDR